MFRHFLDARQRAHLIGNIAHKTFKPIILLFAIILMKFVITKKMSTQISLVQCVTTDIIYL